MSQDEYERLVDACAYSGAHSISDFARLAVFQVIRPAGQASTELLNERIQSLDMRTQELDRRLEQLTVLVQGSRQRRPSGPGC